MDVAPRTARGRWTKERHGQDRTQASGSQEEERQPRQAPERLTIETGRAAELGFTVAATDTAAAVGSGSLPVLATPRLLAWCEAATCAAIEPDLPPGQTSVGTRVSLEHRAASPVGGELTVRATVTHVDGRLVRFGVRATAPDGKAVATGEVTRVVVDAERFLERIG